MFTNFFTSNLDNGSNNKKRNSKAKYSDKRKANLTKSKKNTFNKNKKKVSSTGK